ncbi:hypothetical protein ONZ45_g17053 [Pleurotus djamor]|nr:hypothetical protein ONZ45_g17053 [Pleurotus djamor]
MSSNPPNQPPSNLPLLTASGMQLRQKRSHNVGAPDMKPRRRPIGEAATEIATKKEQKRGDEARRTKALKKVAQLEHQASTQDKENSAPYTPKRSKVTTGQRSQISASKDDFVPDSEPDRQESKKERKRRIRRYVEDERSNLDRGDRASAGEKRKKAVEGDAAPEEPSPKKKKTQRSEGLREDFVVPERLERLVDQPSNVNVQRQRVNSQPLGGISDADEADISAERCGLDQDIIIAALARINPPIVASPQVARKKFGRKKKKTITYQDIPEALRPKFSENYVPYAIREAGTQGPWYAPNYFDAEVAWGRVFTSQAQPRFEHIEAAEKLINNSLYQLHNKTKEIAVKALDRLLADEGRHTTEEKAVRVQELLGNGILDPEAPYFYKLVKGTVKKGIFQSPLIAAAFSLHLATISAVPECFEPVETPSYQSGALVVAIQAVCRALTLYRTGVKEEPGPRDTHLHFSSSNWSDYEETYIRADGSEAKRIIQRESMLTQLVQQLSPAKWKKINAAALEHLTSPHPVAITELEATEPHIFKLVDHDDDGNDTASDSSGDPIDDFHSRPDPDSPIDDNDDADVDSSERDSRPDSDLSLMYHPQNKWLDYGVDDDGADHDNY